MNENREFPAELVEARAKELNGAHCDGSEYGVRWVNLTWEGRESYRREARLSLRREVEACEPLVEKVLRAIEVLTYWNNKRHLGLSGKLGVLDELQTALAAHRARYAPTPKPETLADVAREAAEALSGNAALSERLLAACERESKRGAE